MTYRFIGTVAEIRGIVDLKYFGQSVELSEQLAKDAILGSCAILPESDFNAIGFTEKELKQYANPGPRQAATEEFNAKFEIAKSKLHDIRECLERTGVFPAQQIAVVVAKQ